MILADLTRLKLNYDKVQKLWKRSRRLLNLNFDLCWHLHETRTVFYSLSS